MASLSSPTLVEARTPRPAGADTAASDADVVLVAGRGNPAADYAAWLRRQGDGRVVVADAQTEPRRVSSVVLFLGPTEADLRAADDLLGPGIVRPSFVCVVSTLRAHFGDRAAAEAEARWLDRARALGARAVVFRTAPLLSPGSRAAAVLRRFGFCWPLVPRRLRGCCLDGEELFAAIERERRDPRPRRPRVFTLLGPNRPWRDRLAEHGAKGPWRACLTVACALLSLLLVGHLAALVLALLARRRPALRRWSFDTLRPESFGELLALYNPYNRRHVKVVGYNNGVVHFGQRFPGKTVVSTVRCDRVVRAGADAIKADCGATVRKALGFLAGAGQTLPVIPNYSYVSLGTAFFVPIHGSAADVSAVAETITKAVLYDPAADRLVVTTRDEPAFREHVYNLKADVLLLRLYLRVKPRSRYYLRTEELEDPGSDELLAALRDDRATNVEVRKSRAAGSAVRVARFYNDRPGADCPVLELPRDALGRLWDSLEERAVTSFLMHALTRHLAWHVELFFTADEFATFWATHRDLPLRKIQLRYLRRDGFPHSPCRDHGCVSADLFLFRPHRRRFEDYLKRTFAVVRSNPGKHSR
jgi:hypothetical protein